MKKLIKVRERSKDERGDVVNIALILGKLFYNDRLLGDNYGHWVRLRLFINDYEGNNIEPVLLNMYNCYRFV